jgi:hypothetical protein
MEKIPAVETAKALMTEALAWSVMKWLRQKKTVRMVADQANTALDQLNQKVKDRWPADIRVVYEALVQQGARTVKTPRRDESNSPLNSGQAVLSLTKVKEADQRAYRARMDAEESFDSAEKQLSTALAREGCRKAIHSWELHEKAIQIAEALIV